MPADRRLFLKALAIAPLAPRALAPAPASAPLPATAPAVTETVADALAEAARREFGAHLDPGELAAVRLEIARSLEGAARLRAAARLRNGDEPVCLFDPRPPQAEGRARRGRR